MNDHPLRARRDDVVDRYADLARTALAGGSITDCDPDAFAGGGFGAAAYSSAEDAPASSRLQPPLSRTGD